LQLAAQITASPALAGALVLMVSPATQGTSLERYREITVATVLTKPIAPAELWEAATLVLGPAAVTPAPASPGQPAAAAEQPTLR
jgi:hypothetical protein